MINLQQNFSEFFEVKEGHLTSIKFIENFFNLIYNFWF
jgi:hypothetical protein